MFDNLKLGLFIGTIYGVYAFQRRYKANKLHQRAKKQLAILDDQDDFWNEKRIKEEVKKSYYLIQEAWGRQDLKTLKKYLTENLYDAWVAKINWNEFQGLVDRIPPEVLAELKRQQRHTRER